MTWYTVSCRKNGHGLTIIQVILYGQRFIYFYFWHWIQWLLCDWRTMLELRLWLWTLLEAWATRGWTANDRQ
jgi:hypothetical protein